ncbi:MAG TPA: hypothetical protein VFA50_01735 [Stellaceae bacterium]|nr:hypothetical protein [Stellaceae bacterium]
MRAKAKLVLALLPLLAGLLSGCVVYETGPGWHHPHYWDYR